MVVTGVLTLETETSRRANGELTDSSRRVSADTTDVFSLLAAAAIRLNPVDRAPAQHVR